MIQNIGELCAAATGTALRFLGQNIHSLVCTPIKSTGRLCVLLDVPLQDAIIITIATALSALC